MLCSESGKTHPSVTSLVSVAIELALVFLFGAVSALEVFLKF